ncbi:MAG: polysaccharide deacetylase family protein [Chloroflexi bacterium]|nr:polysaccharide deacetylase family protein [Chloroflexota bacterium]
MDTTRKKAPLVIRLDDVGACSKKYEIYSRIQRRVGPLGVPSDWLFLKYLPGLKAWGPYPEISAKTWRRIIAMLKQYDARLVLGVTASWVESEQELIPYPDKFPEAAAVLKDACHRGLVEIANHGLTHCVIADNAFKPRWFSGNREYHREFSPLVPQAVQEEHLQRSQKILQDYFETEVVTFIPPGKHFSDTTLNTAESLGFRYISYSVQELTGVVPIPMLRALISQEVDAYETDAVVPAPTLLSFLTRTIPESRYRVMGMHDRDIVMKGLDWFEQILKTNADAGFGLARDAGSSLVTADLAIE